MSLQGDLLAQDGIDRAEAHADHEWINAARRIVWQLIQAGDPFTTDAVWAKLDALGVSTHEPRALGTVMRAAARAGWIEQTGDYVRSARPHCHSRPIPCWMPRRTAA